MNYPAAQDAFASQWCLFHDAGKGEVLGIA
jgi:hypothetical protein